MPKTIDLLDNIQHTLNRGVLGIDIFNNRTDRERFTKILRYKNHDESIHRWHKTVDPITSRSRMPWPEDERGEQ